jgi:archaellum component FlaC
VFYHQSVTIDERLDRLTERHEALTQSVELLTIDTRQLVAGTRELKALIAQDAENIRAHARIAEIHERRITRMEDNQE